MITIGCEYQRGRGVAREQMSACTRSTHIRRIIASLRYYQQSQMVEIIAATFRRGNNFLAKGRWEKKKRKRVQAHAQVTSHVSAWRPAGCSRQQGRRGRYM